jgi:Cu-Zn family superoxide dismutase
MQSRTLTLASILAVALSGAALAEARGKARLAPGKLVPILLADSTGRSIGTAVMTWSPGGIAFKLNLRRLPPGEHAVMLHETGACEAPYFQSAGGLLEAPSIIDPGDGDRPRVSLELDDILADATGHVRTTVIVSDTAMYGMLVGGNGSAFVIYASADASADGLDRIACGVIPGAAGKPRP